MGEPAQAATSGEAPPPEDAAPTVSLQILSPSVGVNRPLGFSGLPASITIRQLKEKIRDALANKPTDDQQRLIHRGRLLARDTETLQDVFGVEALRSRDPQTLHLVLRDLHDHHASSSQQPTPLRGQTPVPGALPTRHSDPHTHTNPQNPAARMGRATPVHTLPNPPATMHGWAHPGLTPQMQMTQQHQTMVQWTNQIQREANYRQYLSQHPRPPMGYPDPAFNPPPPNTGENPSGRNSPAVGQQFVHGPATGEASGPNGQHLRMTIGDAHFTVRTSSPQPGRGPVHHNDVQNIIRDADATQATQTMTNAIHRTASGTSLANLNAPVQPIPPGVTTPIYPGASWHRSRTATSDPASNASTYGDDTTPTPSQYYTRAEGRRTSHQPEVYILSSPTGPRALLINNTSEAYYTPMTRQAPVPYIPFFRQPYYFSPYPLGPVAQQQHIPAQVRQAQPVQVHIRRHQHQAQNENNHRHHHHPYRQNFPGLGPFRPHPHNPGIGPLVAAAWPYIWLIIRLAALVWWFTASDTSWSRWFVIISIAITIFAINTGILNGVVNQAWDPFRRHLEGVLPLGDPNRPRQPVVVPPNFNPQPGGNHQQGGPPAPAVAGAGAGAPAGRAPRSPADAAEAARAARGADVEPDPAAAAARLVAQRRIANANWLMDQMRRVERAGLLFLASIAPGVAERHIAHLEAQERLRREEEEGAAADYAAAVRYHDALDAAYPRNRARAPAPAAAAAAEPTAEVGAGAGADGGPDTTAERNGSEQQSGAQTGHDLVDNNQRGEEQQAAAAQEG